MERAAVPSPSPVFVGREAALARVLAGLERLSVAVVYGVGGVGKSALAYASAARWSAAHPGAAVVHRRIRSEPLGVLCDDLRRALAAGSVPEAASDDERLADLAERLDAAPALLVLDDLHALAEVDRRALVGALASSLGRSRVLATSRELVGGAPVGPDRLEVHLEGLDDEASHALWKALDELYGPALGFEVAQERARGNPFALRRAHAGGLDDDDPIEAAVSALSADEAKVAGVLALADWRLPLSVLSRLLPAAGARAAVRRLVTLLIADVDGAGTVGIHGLFQETILASLAPELRRALSGELAGALREAPFDVVFRVREMARHLVAAERWNDACELVVSSAVDLVRSGATSELLRSLEAIPLEHRTADAQLARARCLVRMMDLGRGYDELSRLYAAGVADRFEIEYSLGTTAFMMGRVDEGARVLEGLLDSPDTPAGLREQVLMQYAWMITSLGRGEEGRRLLEDAERRAADPQKAALHALYRAVSLWSDERDDELAEVVRRARSLLPDAGPPFATSNLAPPLIAAMLARLGHVSEAHELLALSEKREVRGEDLQSRVQDRRMRAWILYETGDRLGALELLRGVVATYERSSSAVSALTAAAWVGRTLLALGRRKEGLAILDETTERAARLGLHGVVAIAARSRAWDPLDVGALARDAPIRMQRSERRGDVVRRRAAAALDAATRGEVARVPALVAEIDRDATGPGYGLDRAMARIAAAILARLSGRSAEAARELARAAAEAAADGVDDDLVRALAERISGPVIVTGARRSAAPPGPSAPDLSKYEVILDGRQHELRLKRKVVSLKKRPVLRRLLYALAVQPNAIVSKETLAGSLWSTRYNPLRHDNALWVNLRRLRMLLARTGLSIELGEDGYKLLVPDRFVYVDPGPTS